MHVGDTRTVNTIQHLKDNYEIETGIKMPVDEQDR
jgi:hypothetical protein